MLQQHLVRDEDVEPLAEAVLDVLERVGILCQNDELLGLLDKAGATVDFAAQRARFPKQMVREYVAQFRAQRHDELPCEPFRAPGKPMLGTQVAQFYLDPATGERRSGNTRDFIECVKLGEVLHGDQGVGHALLSTDVPPLVEPLNAAILMAEHATRPRGVYPWDFRQIDYLIEMGEILGVEGLWTWGALCFAHPLRLDRDVVNRLVRQAKAGASIGITAMPVVGVSTPVTVEGFIAVSAAEIVSVWICGRIINPEVSLGGSMWAGTVDMKTGDVSYSTYDAMYHAFAVNEFIRRWTGVNFPPGSGEYSDAKAPGLAALFEKHYKAMTVAAFTGRHPGVGDGMLECGKTLSLVQLMLERDFVTGLEQYERRLDPGDANIVMPDIVAVDLGMTDNYLETMHTARHFRECLFMPKLIERRGWNGAADDEAMIAKARAQVAELLGQYVKPEGREEKLAAMRRVIERAGKELSR
jgi:trimethylamine:corrinoid methyltransferase-like protein